MMRNTLRFCATASKDQGHIVLQLSLGLSSVNTLVCLSLCHELNLQNEYFPVTSKVFYPFPNKPWCLRVCFTSLLETLWKKEK